MAPLLVGFTLALALTPAARTVALHFNDVDHPLGGKIHKLPTPLMGGVAVYGAFAVVAFIFLPLTSPVRGVLVGGLAAVVVGLLDELITLAPAAHFVGQVAAALAAIWFGLGIVTTVSLPSSISSPGAKLPLAVGFIFTVFWLVGMMNTVNFLDGLDGLAPGVACIATGLLAVWAAEAGRFQIPVTPHHEDLILPLALTGAVLGFLPYNWHIARIFLGDSGSMFLGLGIGALAIVGPTKLGTALLILLIPIVDVAWAIVRRRLRGRSFLAGDKQHVYHRMMELGMSHTTTVLALYCLCIALALLDLWLFKFQKLVAFVVLAALAASIFVALEFRASAASP